MEKRNPLINEHAIRVIEGGQSLPYWDNFHQTFYSVVHEPGTFPHLRSPGCPECVHTHWRWGAHIGDGFGGGRPLIPEGSNQDVDIGVSLFRSTEEDPVHFFNLVSAPELISGLDYVGGTTYVDSAKDVVFWYSSTGHLAADTFSPLPGSFYNPSWEGIHATVTDTLPEIPGGHQHNHTSPSNTSVDRPVSVDFCHQFVAGSTGYEALDPAVVGPLPNGYTIYNAGVFQVGTGGLVSGPHVINFQCSLGRRTERLR